jgi:colicin import membrane protein
LGEAGRSSARATLDRVAETLLAASVDQEAAEGVAAGRLERELSPPSGFEAALDAGPAAAASTRRGSDRGRARDTKAKERAERRAREAREAAQEARREARRLAQEAESAERAARRARQRAERAEQRAEEAERKAEELLSRR